MPRRAWKVRVIDKSVAARAKGTEKGDAVYEQGGEGTTFRIACKIEKEILGTIPRNQRRRFFVKHMLR